MDVGRQNPVRVFLTEGFGQCLCGLVGIRDRPFGHQLQGGVGIELDEGGQLVQFAFCAKPFHRHGEHRGE